jgi:hypothetical protein
MFISSPKAFAECFNAKIPDACRKITSDDVRLMRECKLIGRHNYYIRQDLETVRAVLQYEQLRQNRQKKDEIKDAEGGIHCRRCGKLLTTKQSGKKGRHREYCSGCEPFRVRERNRKWRRKGQVSLNYCP